MILTRAALFRIFIDRFIAPRLDPRYMFIPRQFSVLMAENTDFVRKTLPSILRTHMTTDEIRAMKQLIYKAGSKSCCAISCISCKKASRDATVWSRWCDFWMRSIARRRL